jgi:hypothetical protein
VLVLLSEEKSLDDPWNHQGQSYFKNSFIVVIDELYHYVDPTFFYILGVALKVSVVEYYSSQLGREDAWFSCHYFVETFQGEHYYLLLHLFLLGEFQDGLDNRQQVLLEEGVQMLRTVENEQVGALHEVRDVRVTIQFFLLHVGEDSQKLVVNGLDAGSELFLLEFVVIFIVVLEILDYEVDQHDVFWVGCQVPDQQIEQLIVEIVYLNQVARHHALYLL